MSAFRLCLLAACLHLAGCENIDYTLNDTLVYGPSQLLRHIPITDPALEACIAQQIIDQRITQASDLRILNCSNAGIESLEGLGHFSALEHLKLSDNKIRNLLELSRIEGLQSLWLDGNHVVDPVPLNGLKALSQLDLSRNPALQCPRPDTLASVMQLTLPEHCPDTDS